MTRRLQGLPKGSLEHAYSLTHSVAFAGYAAGFLRARGWPSETSPRVLRGALRVAFLADLRAKGYEGVDDFLYTFISSLLERRQDADLCRARLPPPPPPSQQPQQPPHAAEARPPHPHPHPSPHPAGQQGGAGGVHFHGSAGPLQPLSGAAQQMRRGAGKVGADR
jgi:hypothetical protein